MSRFLLFGLGLVTVVACRLDRSAFDFTDPGPLDACVSATETCDRADNDCDGRIDEDFDLERDVGNCGECGNGCEAGPASSATCVGGVCALDCEPGFADCDRISANGCEANLMRPESCGSCRTQCAAPTPNCAEGAGGIVCVGQCPPETPVLCEAFCVDTASDPSHCNGCDIACPGVAGATATCEMGVCGFECASAVGDCDGNSSNGCEQQLNTDTHCGACGAACTPPHATGDCSSGSCMVSACDANFDDCDRDASNGCETSLRTNAEHCGMCGNVCPGTACIAGACDTSGLVGDVAVGAAFTLALRGTGVGLGWGRNQLGQLTLPTSPTPVLMPTDLTIVDLARVSAGTLHGCAMDTMNRGWCWGSDANGRLGRMGSASPAIVPALGLIQAISAGGAHSCAITDSGAVECWGRNNRDQLGTSGSDRTTPRVLDTSITDAADVSAGFDHSCAVRLNGDVLCWGHNNRGQLGDGTTSDSVDPVMAAANGTSVSAGDEFTCATFNNGRAFCWGTDATGQLGDGPGGGSGIVRVGNLTNVIAVDAGTDHACALRNDGLVYCWGANTVGQVGDGTVIDRASPVLVGGINDAVDISAGDEITCVAHATGAVSCWGLNAHGQLGDGTMTDSRVPVSVMGLP